MQLLMVTPNLIINVNNIIKIEKQYNDITLSYDAMWKLECRKISVYEWEKIVEYIYNIKPDTPTYTPIETLHLSTRTINSLMSRNIWSIEFLLQHSIMELATFRGLWKKALWEIGERLTKKWYMLSNDWYYILKTN